MKLVNEYSNLSGTWREYLFSASADDLKNIGVSATGFADHCENTVWRWALDDSPFNDEANIYVDYLRRDITTGAVVVNIVCDLTDCS